MAKLAAINKEISEYINDFKANILTEFNTLSCTSTKSDEFEKFQKFICNYNVLKIAPKQKNPKNFIIFDKCLAKLETGIQCKCKKQKNSVFCKKHLNNTQFGIVNVEEKLDNNHIANTNKTTLKLYIYNDRGIQCYVDEEGNVYDTQSVLVPNGAPKIIRKLDKELIIKHCQEDDELLNEDEI